MVPAVVGKGALDGDRALRRLSGAVEDGEETVPPGLYVARPVLSEELAHHTVVPADQLRPGVVADQFNQVRRCHDVGEEVGSVAGDCGSVLLAEAVQQAARLQSSGGSSQTLEGCFGRAYLEPGRGKVTLGGVRPGEQQARPPAFELRVHGRPR